MDKKLRILIIGGYGTLGKKVAHFFKEGHDVLIAGRNQGDYRLDINESKDIKRGLEEIGKVDAIVNIAGEAKWGPFDELTEADYYIGLKSKLMGQVNLVRVGQDYLNKNGSITLTSGILADDPVFMTASAAMVNGGIHSFVKAASLELQHKLRLNVVSSGLVEDAYERYKDYFPGHHVIPMEKMVNGYARSVLGKGNGEVIRIYD
ncbi:MAG: short chain dehydrogenase [Bacteroidota bacterium]